MTSQTLGLVGGTGIEAGIFYYRRLHELQLRSGHALSMVLVHADVQRVLRHAVNNELVSLADYLASSIAQLRDAGATVCAIAAATPHICVGELRERIDVPLIDLVDVARGLSEPGKRALIVGTRPVMESKIFGALDGMDVLPNGDDLSSMDAMYREVAQSTANQRKARENLAEFVRRMHAAKKPDRIVIAGTDASPIFSNVDFADLPIVDLSDAHIQAIHARLVS